MLHNYLILTHYLKCKLTLSLTQKELTRLVVTFIPKKN